MIKLLFSSFVFLICIIQVSNCQAKAQLRSKRDGDCNNRVVGYFTSWGKNDFTEEQAHRLTHLIFAFVRMEADGSLSLGNVENSPNNNEMEKTTTLRLLKTLITSRSNKNLKVLFAIGGWENSQYFSSVVADSGKRQTFIKHIIVFVMQWYFDGVDIDWEYPVKGGANEGIAADRENYVTFLRELRSALDVIQRDSHRLILSIASAAGAWNIKDGYDLNQIANIIDFFNIMTYDYYGAWQSDAGKITGPPAPLFMGSPKGTSGKLNQHWTMKYYACRSKNIEKLTLGLPFYGRYWKHVGEPLDPNDGMWRTASRPNGQFEGGFLNWREIGTMFDKNTASWQDKAKAPYIFDGSTFFGFENEQSLNAKIDYATEQGFGGIMLWSIDGDDDALTLLKTVTSRKWCAGNGSGKYKCPSTDEKRWYTLEDSEELAGRCGKRAPPIDGKYLAVCDPDDPGYSCCSKSGYCGMGDDFCKCDGCFDYGENPDKIDQPSQSDPFDPNRDYKVKAGDTAFEIAQKHGIKLDKLKELNKDINFDQLQIDDVLRVKD